MSHKIAWQIEKRTPDWLWYAIVGPIAWFLIRRIGRVVCFFKGHNIKRGESRNYEPDWCDRCFADWPDNRKTWPKIYERLRGW